MLNFRSVSIFMAILAFMIFLLMDARVESLWILLPLALIYLIILVLGSMKISSGFFLEAFCKGITNKKVVALTFDDGPDEKNTPLVLNILDKHHIRATFFVIGHKAEKLPVLLQKIVSQGHLIGIHSYYHNFFFDFSGRKKMEQDLHKTREIILEATGKDTLMFRPPYGVTNPVVAKVVKKLGYKVIGWSVRSFDTTINDADRVANRVLKGLHPGAVILMHDTQDITPEAVEIIIRKATGKGYRFAGLEELLGIVAIVK